MSEAKEETIDTFLDNEGKVAEPGKGTQLIRVKIVDGVVTERTYYYTKDYVAPKTA